MGLFSILKDKAGQGTEADSAYLEDHSLAARAKSEFQPKRQAHFNEAPVFRWGQLSTIGCTYCYEAISSIASMQAWEQLPQDFCVVQGWPIQKLHSFYSCHISSPLGS